MAAVMRSTLPSGTSAGSMSSAVETSNLTWPLVCSLLRSDRAVVIMPSDGSRAIVFSKLCAMAKVAMPGPHPTSSAFSSLPPVDVWCEMMSSYRAWLYFGRCWA